MFSLFVFAFHFLTLSLPVFVHSLCLSLLHSLTITKKTAPACFILAYDQRMRQMRLVQLAPKKKNQSVGHIALSSAEITEASLAGQKLRSRPVRERMRCVLLHMFPPSHYYICVSILPLRSRPNTSRVPPIYSY